MGPTAVAEHDTLRPSRRVLAGVDELRALELDRLERLHEAAWPRAMAGDLALASLILSHGRARQASWAVCVPGDELAIGQPTIVQV